MDIEQFKKDYLVMSNSELEDKYEISTTSIWLLAQRLELKRGDNYYHSNLIHATNNNLWINEEIGFLKQYKTNPHLSFDWLRKRVSRSDDSIRLKLKSLPSEFVPRAKERVNPKLIKKIKREHIKGVSAKALMKKYSIGRRAMERILRI